MNSKTASHLNRLREAAQHVKLHSPAETITGPYTDALQAQIAAIEIKYTDATIEKLIREAAANKEYADVLLADWAKRCFGGYTSLSDPPTRMRWNMARAEILMAIEAHNTISATRYEAYRLACEQGVAVPPSE